MIPLFLLLATVFGVYFWGHAQGYSSGFAAGRMQAYEEWTRTFTEEV